LCATAVMLPLLSGWARWHQRSLRHLQRRGDHRLRDRPFEGRRSPWWPRAGPSPTRRASPRSTGFRSCP